MPKYKLEHVKTYNIGAFSSFTDEFGFHYSRSEMLWKSLQHEFKCNKYVGMIFYKDGTTETLGCVNILGGICDDCIIDKESIKKIEVFKLV